MVVPCKAALALTRLCRSSGIIIVVLCPLIAMVMYGILYLQLTISYTHLRFVSSVGRAVSVLLNC